MELMYLGMVIACVGSFFWYGVSLMSVDEQGLESLAKLHAI